MAIMESSKGKPVRLTSGERSIQADGCTEKHDAHESFSAAHGTQRSQLLFDHALRIIDGNGLGREQYARKQQPGC